MLSYDLTEEQEILRKTVRAFAEKEIAPIARELDEKEVFSVPLTEKMAALGLLGMVIPEAYGGTDMGYISYIVAVEELARVDGSQAATIAAANSLGIGPIFYFGTEAQKQKYLPDLCRGKALASFGLTEAEAGTDAAGSKTHAVKKNDHWILNGSKIFITNAATPLSSVVTVQAVTGKQSNGTKEFSCFLVPTNSTGFEAKEMHGKMMWRASNTAELYFNDVELPEEAVLGIPGRGFQQMLQTLDSGRLAIAAMGLGGAQGAYEKALAYAKERKQFGKPIAKNQAIAFKLADMATQIEAARNMLYKACWLREQNKPFQKMAAMSKLFCSEVFRFVATEAVQIHGGYGLMKEYDVERFFRDQKLLEIGEGTSEVQRMVISRYLGC